jgi:hypothetical protein
MVEIDGHRLRVTVNFVLTLGSVTFSRQSPSVDDCQICYAPHRWSARLRYARFCGVVACVFRTLCIVAWRRHVSSVQIAIFSSSLFVLLSDDDTATEYSNNICVTVGIIFFPRATVSWHQRRKMSCGAIEAPLFEGITL